MRSFIEEKIQILLNRYLALDPESEKRLRILDGKVVTIAFTTHDNHLFQLHFTAHGVQIKSSDMTQADTIIQGTPISLLHMSLSPNQRKKFFADDVSIEGDLEVGQQVIALFDECEIDWEEYLSHYIGDVSAHNLGNFARKITKFRHKLSATLWQNINEYLHEEIHLVPPSEKLNDFFQDVDMLRMDVDRLDARIHRLTQSLRTNKEA